MISLEEALRRLLEGVQPLTETRKVPTQEANGRVLAEAVVSDIHVPGADCSSMDGYAVISTDCTSDLTTLEIVDRIPAAATGKPLQSGQAARIFTGAALPMGADTIVIQEDCEVQGTKLIFRHRPAPGEWVRKTGENIRKGETILKKGTPLRPQHLGLAASVGRENLTVVRPLRVALVSTGNEIVRPGQALKPGQIFDANYYLLSTLLQNFGCTVTDHPNVPDDIDLIRQAFLDTVDEHDLIIASGGVSVGEEDYIRQVVTELGWINLWQIAIKPGKPLVYGDINRNRTGTTPFLGLPGNPVSSFVTFLLFVRPFILRMMGVEEIRPHAAMMRADFSMEKMEGRNEFLRARINDSNGLDLFDNQGSGVLASVVFADGLIDNPPANLIKKGDMVRFLPFNRMISI